MQAYPGCILFNCTRCIQAALTDLDIQVQSIGLQVLKSILLRGTNAESSCFLIFFIGELLRDVLTITQHNLKKPTNREAVAVVGECLKILMLLETLSKATECQKGLMNLLLETIVLVFSTLEDDLSQDVNDLRNTTIRLVSQLTQIPKSASFFKDVLLAMQVNPASISELPSPISKLEMELTELLKSRTRRGFPISILGPMTLLLPLWEINFYMEVCG